MSGISPRMLAVVLAAATAFSQTGAEKESPQRNIPATPAQLSNRNTSKTEVMLGSLGKATSLMVIRVTRYDANTARDKLKNVPVVLKPEGDFSLETARQAIGEELTRPLYHDGEEVQVSIGSTGARLVVMNCSRLGRTVSCNNPQFGLRVQ